MNGDIERASRRVFEIEQQDRPRSVVEPRQGVPNGVNRLFSQKRVELAAVDVAVDAEQVRAVRGMP